MHPRTQISVCAEFQVKEELGPYIQRFITRKYRLHVLVFYDIGQLHRCPAVGIICSNTRLIVSSSVQTIAFTHLGHGVLGAPRQHRVVAVAVLGHA